MDSIFISNFNDHNESEETLGINRINERYACIYIPFCSRRINKLKVDFDDTYYSGDTP